MNVSKDYAIKLHSSENMANIYKYINHDKFQSVQRFKQITITYICFDTKYRYWSCYFKLPGSKDEYRAILNNKDREKFKFLLRNISIYKARNNLHICKSHKYAEKRAIKNIIARM